MSSLQAQGATINGGIKFEWSDYQADTTLPTILTIPDTLIFPLGDDVQHLAKPLVNIGEQVFAGQLIAQSENTTDVMIHASSSGTVVAIQEINTLLENNKVVPSIVIKTDGKDLADVNRKSGFSNYKQVEPVVLQKNIIKHGITNLSSVAFDPVEFLIINAVECEPLINRNGIFIQHYADELVTGIKILQHIFQVKQCVIAIEENRKTAIQVLKQLINDADVQIQLVERRYPIAHDALLKQALVGQNPKLKNVMSFNLETVYAVKLAVLDDTPLNKQLITIVDTTHKKLINRWVYLGAEIEHVFKHIDVLNNDDDFLVMGGPMQGIRLQDINTPVSKKTNALFIASGQEQKARTCIRCNECVAVCPVSLQPQQLHKYSQSFNSKRLNQLALFDCIECGCCNFVCPSHIPLVTQFQIAKKSIQQEQQAKENLQRYENKLKREQKREQEKKQRSVPGVKQTFESSESEQEKKQQVIADAVARVKEKRKKQQ